MVEVSVMRCCRVVWDDIEWCGVVRSRYYLAFVLVFIFLIIYDSYEDGVEWSGMILSAKEW